jgi:hypothetical protein
MNEFQRWSLAHPVLVGWVFGGIVGFGAYNAFRGGLAYAQLRQNVSDAAFSASEGLGG